MLTPLIVSPSIGSAARGATGTGYAEGIACVGSISPLVFLHHARPGPVHHGTALRAAGWSAARCRRTAYRREAPEARPG